MNVQVASTNLPRAKDKFFLVLAFAAAIAVFTVGIIAFTPGFSQETYDHLLIAVFVLTGAVVVFTGLAHRTVYAAICSSNIEIKTYCKTYVLPLFCIYDNQDVYAQMADPVDADEVMKHVYMACFASIPAIIMTPFCIIFNNPVVYVLMGLCGVFFLVVIWASRRQLVTFIRA
jgi:hypothetical protein